MVKRCFPDCVASHCTPRPMALESGHLERVSGKKNKKEVIVQTEATLQAEPDIAAYWAYETAANLVMEFGLVEAAQLCRKASWNDVLAIIQTEWRDGAGTPAG